MTYTDKTDRVEKIKDLIKSGREDLHPQDHAEACREIEIFAGKEANRQQETNDEQGVPER